MHLRIQRVDWQYKTVFRIAYKARTHAETVLVELTDGCWTGRGEALGVSYHGENVKSMLRQLSGIQSQLQKGVTRAELQRILPPGGARNAVGVGRGTSAIAAARNAGSRSSSARFRSNPRFDGATVCASAATVSSASTRTSMKRTAATARVTP